MDLRLLSPTAAFWFTQAEIFLPIFNIWCGSGTIRRKVKVTYVTSNFEAEI
jgi:hypothetical protein